MSLKWWICFWGGFSFGY